MRRLAVLWLVLFCARPLSAQTATLPALHWTRAESAQSCIDPRTLAQRVEALTGRVLVPASDAELSIEGSIERRKTGYRARIVATRAARGPRGQRVLEQPGEDCRALDAALVLVIALFIDPQLAARGLPPELLALLPASERAPEQALLDELTHEPPPAEPPAAPRASLPPPAPVPQAEPPPVLRPRWTLGLAGQVVGASLPALALGLTADAAYRVTARMAAALWTQFSTTVREAEISGGRGISAQSLSGAAMFCPWFGYAARWSSAACLGPELGWLQATPSGFARGRSAALSTFGALLRLSAGYRLTRALDLKVGGFLRVNLAERRLVYEDFDQRPEVYRVPAVGLGGELGLAYAF